MTQTIKTLVAAFPFIMPDDTTADQAVYQVKNTDELRVNFMGVYEHTEEGSVLPSYKFVYQVQYSSFELEVFIDYTEIGNDEPEDAAYDVRIDAEGDSCNLTMTRKAINAVVDMHVENDHNLLDLS